MIDERPSPDDLRRLHRYRMCAEKVRHPNRRDAEMIAARMRERRHADVDAYGCPYCNQWHVGRVRDG